MKEKQRNKHEMKIAPLQLPVCNISVHVHNCVPWSKIWHPPHTHTYSWIINPVWLKSNVTNVFNCIKKMTVSDLFYTN